jgi:ceramide glucosyltransferase
MPELSSELIVDVLYVLLLLTVATNVASAAYVLTAIHRVNGFKRLVEVSGTFRPPVTVLKPIYGLDVGLYENLRSFCHQDYPRYQIVFGVQDAADPAVRVIERLIGEFPKTDITLIVDSRVAGANLKASNLENIYHVAKHDLLVIADSDMRVDEKYLATVIAPFEDSKVGVVTCLYKGTSTAGVPSLLASMFINEWFLPSVLVSAGIRDIRFCFGATMAVRRHLLDMIGGFKTLAQYLADDHMLGKLVSAQGFKVALSGYIVENMVFEENFMTLFKHELRWARTVRTVEPLGHAFSFIMYGVPLAFFGALMVDLTFDWDWFEVALIVLAVSLRVSMHFAVRRKLDLPKDRSLWLVPLRDILSFVIWGTSFFGRRIDWKGRMFDVRPDGFVTASKGFESR